MRPFGCPVTILNTIDHLGKFDGKADEGFFVGYSTNSKTYKVFNSRTRIVEENLHIQFRNQSNGSTSSKACDNAGKIKKEEKKDAEDPGNESGNPTKGKDSEVSKVTTNLPLQNSGASDNDKYLLNFPLALSNENDDEDVGAEADINNLDTHIPVSPIPTTRIHKDHPMDVKSAFLYGKIEEEVYVCQPPRFEDPDFPDITRIFRYLKGQPKLGLWYPKDLPFDLVAYTDNDYGGASLDMKSTIGGFQFLGCRLISWQCKKQIMVANSITKGGYIAASNCYGQVALIQIQLIIMRYNFKRLRFILIMIAQMILEWNAKAAKDGNL
ncbi:ribonuclease H-like domain-containing protein, partial [Tanacetum coccineum]